MHCTACQQKISSAAGLRSLALCEPCHQQRSGAVVDAARSESRHFAAEHPLADGLGKRWRLDVDLQTSESVVRAWRQRDPALVRPGALRRIDPPEMAESDVKPNQPVGVAEDSPQSADSIVAIVVCELMAIVALLILLYIEAQHSPHFFKFAIVALVGAGVVMLLTFARWKLEQRRPTRDAERSPADVRVDVAETPAMHAPKSDYQSLARATRPADWQ